MSKYNVSQEDKEQLGGEIDNQGLEYWLAEYASSSEELQRYPELRKLAMKAAEAIKEIEAALDEEGIGE